ncbi:MAG: RNA-guided endonuclease TnpB family protein, partial [Bacilli bacterium]
LRATITKNSKGYTLSLCIEEVVIKPVSKAISDIPHHEIIGIDLGLKTFATVSNGDAIESFEKPSFLQMEEKKLAKAQRRLARKKEGSNRYLKQKAKVSRRMRHVANQRKDIAHQLSRTLVNKNHVVVVETLRIRNLVKNRRLAKVIHDAGWYQFMTFLSYKLKWEGKTMVKVDPFFASSKRCSSCGTKKQTLHLSERAWTCLHCGKHHDRDENAAHNIRQEGLRILGID